MTVRRDAPVCSAIASSAAFVCDVRRLLAREECADASVEGSDGRSADGERSDQRLQQDAARTRIEIGMSGRGKRQRGEGEDDFEHGEPCESGVYRRGL